MPLEFYVDTAEIIDLDEFILRVERKVDPANPASLANVRDDLVALANNKNFVLERLHRDIESWRSPKFSMYSAQSCLLERFGPFSVRVNLWPSEVNTPGERDALSYNAYHDHNFSFLTTNFYGPGYKTDIYEYSLERSEGRVGGSVSLVRVGERQLRPGSVFCYLKGQDLHAQIPPVEPSASLNLILTDGDVLNDDQYYFDVSRSLIVGMVENVSSKKVAAMDFGYFLLSDESLPYLRDIAQHSPCRRARENARQLLWLHELRSDPL